MKRRKIFVGTLIICIMTSTFFSACDSQKEEIVQGTDVVLEELKQKYQSVDVEEEDSVNEESQDDRFHTEVIDELIEDFGNQQDDVVDNGVLWIMTTGVGDDHVSGEQTRLYLK